MPVLKLEIHHDRRKQPHNNHLFIQAKHTLLYLQNFIKLQALIKKKVRGEEGIKNKLFPFILKYLLLDYLLNIIKKPIDFTKNFYYISLQKNIEFYFYYSDSRQLQIAEELKIIEIFFRIIYT